MSTFYIHTQISEKEKKTHRRALHNLRLQHLINQNDHHLLMIVPQFKHIPQNADLSFFRFSQNFEHVVEFRYGCETM